MVMRMLGQKWPALLQVPSEAVAVGEGLLMFEMHLYASIVRSQTIIYAMPTLRCGMSRSIC